MSVIRSDPTRHVRRNSRRRTDAAPLPRRTARMIRPHDGRVNE